MAIDLLTDIKVKNATAGDKPSALISDGGGLYLAISGASAKSWVFRYKVDGKESRMGLGSYPEISLAMARKKAFDLRQKVALGEDIRKQKVVIPTVGEVMPEFLRVQGIRKSDQRVKKISEALNKHVLPKLKNRKINSIGSIEIVELLKAVEECGTYISKRVYSYLRWFFDYAITLEYISVNPVSTGTLQHLQIHKGENIKSLKFERLAAFLADLNDYRGSPVGKYAMRFMLYTAVRTCEMRRLKWEWIDFENALILFPATSHKIGIAAENKGKDGEEMCVLLSRQAIAILERMKGITGENELVFPCPYDFKVQASDAIINDAIKRMGWSGEHSGHGFRALFRSQMEEEGHDVKLLELCLSHGLGRSKTEQAYARGIHLMHHEERQTIMQVWADLVDSVK